MNINDFIYKVCHHKLPDAKIWCFFSAPSLSVIRMIQCHADAFASVGIQYLNLHDIDMSEVSRHISTLFLGQRYVYILEGVYALDKQSQKRLYDILFTSQISHHVVCFTDQESLVRQYLTKYSTGYGIRCHQIDRKAFSRLFYILFQYTFPDRFLAHIFNVYHTLHFEEAYAIMSYYHLLGKRFPEWCQRWMSRIVSSRMSLFQLSEYFFNKNVTKFWFMWHEIQPMYPPEFWIAFWSEQLWQTYTFISIAKHHTVSRARKSVNKLPFSVMNDTWRRISMQEVAQAITYVYEVDLSLKSGGTYYVLELFLCDWLYSSLPQKTVWCNNTSRDNDCHSFLPR